MKNTVVRAITATILIAIILLFAIFLIVTIVRSNAANNSWQKAQKQTENPQAGEITENEKAPPPMNEFALYLATGAAGLISSFFARMLGVDIEDYQVVSSWGKKFWNSMKEFFRFVGKIIGGLADEQKYNKLMEQIGITYLIVYLIIAIVCIWTWAAIPDFTPELVKNTAVLSGTMFLGIAKKALDSLGQ